MAIYLHMFPAQQGIRKYLPTKNYKYVYINPAYRVLFMMKHDKINLGITWKPELMGTNRYFVNILVANYTISLTFVTKHEMLLLFLKTSTKLESNFQFG